LFSSLFESTWKPLGLLSGWRFSDRLAPPPLGPFVFARFKVWRYAYVEDKLYRRAPLFSYFFFVSQFGPARLLTVLQRARSQRAATCSTEL